MANENEQVTKTSNRRQLQGKVISHNMQKTIVVETEVQKAHPI